MDVRFWAGRQLRLPTPNRSCRTVGERPLRGSDDGVLDGEVGSKNDSYAGL